MNDGAKSFRVGLIGCGRISDIYLKTCAKFSEIEIAACASLDLAESRARADQYGIERACGPDEIFADPSIDGVLNLTIPAAHAEISRRRLRPANMSIRKNPLSPSWTTAGPCWTSQIKRAC